MKIMSSTQCILTVLTILTNSLRIFHFSFVLISFVSFLLAKITADATLSVAVALAVAVATDDVADDVSCKQRSHFDIYSITEANFISISNPMH